MRPSPPTRRIHLGLALRRRPRVRSALAMAAAVACGLATYRTLEAAEAAQTAWGRGTPVLVAARHLEAGERLDASDVRVVPHPAPMVPDGALDQLPEGSRLAHPVHEGEVIVAGRLAPEGLSAVAARLPRGTRAMAIPLDPATTPPLALGDRVDVVVAVPPEAAGGGAPGFVIAERVLVVDITDQAVTVAVPRDVAPRLAVAFGQGAVSVALVGAG